MTTTGDVPIFHPNTILHRNLQQIKPINPEKSSNPQKKQTHKFKTNQHPHGKTNPGQRDRDQHQLIYECLDSTTKLHTRWCWSWGDSIDLVLKHPILSNPLQICPSINSHHTPQTLTTTRSTHPNWEKKKKKSHRVFHHQKPIHHTTEKNHLLLPWKHLTCQQLRTHQPNTQPKNLYC